MTRRAFTSRSNSERIATAAFATVVLAIVVGALVTNRNFWFDEAMAYQAITQQGFLAPGEPLAQYEQAMPYGVYVIFKTLVGLVGLNETILRIPVLLAYVIGLAALWWAARSIRGTFGRVSALVGGGLSVWVVFQAAMFKAYIFEYALGACILACGWALVRSRFRPSSVWLFFAISSVSLLFSNTAPLMTGSVALATLAIGFSRHRDALLRSRWLLLGTGVGYLIIFVAYYLLVTRPSLVYQLSLPIYSQTGFASFFEALAGIYAPTGRPIFLGFGVAVAAVIVIGAVLARRWDRDAWYPFLVVAITVVVIGIGTLTQVAPFTAPRQVLFAVPAIGLAFGAAAQALAEALRPLLRRSVVLRAVALVSVAAIASGFVGIALYGALSKHEEVGRALAAGDERCDTTYTAYSYQPAAEMYVERDDLGIDLVGQVPSRSGMGHNSWFQRIRDNLPAYQDAAVSYFSEVGQGCLLTGPVRERDDLLIPLEEAGIECEPVAIRTGIGLYECAA